MALTGYHKPSGLILDIIIQRYCMGKAEKVYVLIDIAFLLAYSYLLKENFLFEQPLLQNLDP